MNRNGQSFPSNGFHGDEFELERTEPLETSSRTKSRRGRKDVTRSRNSASAYQSPSPPSHAIEYLLPSLARHNDPKPELSLSTIAKAIDLYFNLFHRQPIWCFDRQELPRDLSTKPEVAYSLLELTARFSRQTGLPRYGEIARWNIMTRVAAGTVELETIESLCLLAYSAFIGMVDIVLFRAISKY